MSRLKLSENLFLEVNELQRLVYFLETEGYKRLLKNIVKSYGIVKNDSNTNFKVTQKAGTTNTVIINAGIAFDSNLDAIVMNSNLELTIENTGIKKWIVLSRDVSNWETGTVSVNVDGTLTGVGTKFLSILRGQPNFPVKVKFNSSVNIDEYEVVSVNSDNNAVLAGDFVTESGLKYCVIGTFTPGFQPLEENKKIYEFDSYQITIVDSENRPSVTENQFIIASIMFDEIGVMSVSDERINCIFNEPYVQSDYSVSRADNPLTSLLSVSTVGGVNAVNTVSATFELIIEHGYTVTTHELIVNPNTNIINITGNCNFLGTGNIPDGMFKGWLLLNRKNMKYAVIDNNINKALYISKLDTSIIESGQNDFIIIPNFLEIEYEVKVSSNVEQPDIPFYFKQSVWNYASRLPIYIYMPSVSDVFQDVVTVTVRYRMIDVSGKQYPFNNLAVAQFKNIKGQTETLANSNFNINLADIELQEKQRNYS